jgi:hypothetical protein
MGCAVQPSFVHLRFSWFCLSAPPPNTVGFSWLARLLFHLTMEAALAENLPHRSREHEFSAGRVEIFCENKSLFPL